MSLTATRTPAATYPNGKAPCGRCGVIRTTQPGHPYCPDCLPEARNLGWAPRYRRTQPETSTK